MMDLINKRSGRLLVQERLPNRRWKCLCDCGKTVEVSQDRLRSKRPTRSCGCLVGKSSLPAGTAALNALFSSYKAKALKRGYEFSLELWEFQLLTSEDCHYCGVEPKQIRKQGSCPTVYRYNGVDRIDNDFGYLAGNCYPCCKICNQAKSNLTHAEFIAWLRRAHSHLNLGVKKANF